jgi:hypothetical protein
MQTRKREEHMKVMVMEVPPTERLGMLTKHNGPSFKRNGPSFKRNGPSLKGPTQVMLEEHETGASGDYTVTVTSGKPITISGAIAIRVLDHGELNLVTDAGRWYLFAPQEWQSAFPTQPTPGNSTDE